MANTSTIPPKDHETALKDFLRKVAGDCISDQAMTEIARRLLVFFKQPDPQIIRSATAPSDKSKLWLPVDAVTGAVTGVLQGYDSASGSWVDVSNIGQCISSQEDNLLEVDEEKCLTVPKGKVPGVPQVFDEEITADGDGEAELDLVYDVFEDSDAEIGVNVVDDDPGADFRFVVTDREINGCTVHFFGVTGTVKLKVFARKSN